MKSFLIIIHRVFVNGVTKKGGADRIVDYFIGEGFNLTLIEHPLVDLSQATKVTINGQLAQTWTLNVPSPIRWLGETIFNLYYVLRHGQKYDFILAVDPLSFLSAFFLKKLGRTYKILFHSIDFSERRFSNFFLITFYLSLYRFAVRHSDLVTYVSLTMGERIKEFLGDRDSTKLYYLPNSPEYAKVPRVEPSQKNRGSLVYTKAVISRSEVERLVKLARALVLRFSNLRLTLIGQVDPAGIDIINNIGEKSHFNLVGVVDYQKNLELVSRAALGLAWYEGDLSFEKYADSIKLREYAAAGLPAICNDGIATAFEMEKEGAGLLVRSDEQLIATVEKLLTDEAFYLSTRQKSLAWAKRLDKKLLLRDLTKNILYPIK